MKLFRLIRAFIRGGMNEVRIEKDYADWLKRQFAGK